MSGLVKTGGIVDRLVCVLSHSKWQTASIIACQVTFPPDALARLSTRLMRIGDYSDPATNLARNTLDRMYKRQDVERRISEHGVHEYRLKQWERKRGSYVVRMKYDAYQNGYVRKSDYPEKKKFIEVAEDLVSRGILVEEPDGNFLLNPSISKECKRSEYA